MVRAASGRRSSVVERTLGKGEVDSSILSGGTSELAEFRHSLFKRRGARQGLAHGGPCPGPYCGMTTGGPPLGGVSTIGARNVGGVTGVGSRTRGRTGGVAPPDAAVTRNGATA